MGRGEDMSILTPLQRTRLAALGYTVSPSGSVRLNGRKLGARELRALLARLPFGGVAKACGVQGRRS
jgi:hypothetical protein